MYFFSIPRPKRPWQESPTEHSPPTWSHRRLPSWSEPPPEQSHVIVKYPHKILVAKPKSKPLDDAHYISPALRGPALLSPLKNCTFPRFKRLRSTLPQQSHEKALQLRKKNCEQWIMILAHLHRFSLLYQKTADSKYQDEHVSNILSNYNQISTARHLQVWQHFTDWCEPFGFHPANIRYFHLPVIFYQAQILGDMRTSSFPETLMDFEPPEFDQ